MNIMRDPGSGGPWNWRTLGVANPGSGGPWEWRTLGVANPGSGSNPGSAGPLEWRTATSDRGTNHLRYGTVLLNIKTHICQVIHSFSFYSASSSPLLLGGTPDTARIDVLCRNFTPKRHRQL